MATTLFDTKQYPPSPLTKSYHQRWTVEELYKTIKQTLSLEAFPAQNLAGIQQEVNACITVVALGRLMAKDCEKLVNGADRLTKRGGLLANQKNVIQAVYDGFEEMILDFSKSCANFVNTAMAGVVDCWQ
ncbi:MAG: transposase [Aestuariivita sp.]|nr:transposase [Aestuariivita sp.]MCY4346283.1 transposase [Aestuariivita sp.]